MFARFRRNVAPVSTALGCGRAARNVTQDGDVRVAVLGAASFAEVAHIPGVNAHPHASVVALYGSDLARVHEMAARCGVPDASDDLDAVLGARMTSTRSRS